VLLHLTQKQKIKMTTEMKNETELNNQHGEWRIEREQTDADDEKGRGKMEYITDFSLCVGKRNKNKIRAIN